MPNLKKSIKKSVSKKIRTCGVCGKKLKNPNGRIHIQSVHHRKKLAYSRGGRFIREFEEGEAKKQFLKLYNQGKKEGTILFWGRGNYVQLCHVMKKSLDWHRLTVGRNYVSDGKNQPLLISDVVEVDLRDELIDLFGEDSGKEDNYWGKNKNIDDCVLEYEEFDNNNNNMGHNAGMDFNYNDQLLEDYRDMMLRKKLRLSLPPKRGYDHGWIPKHIWIRGVERMNFFREDIIRSIDNIEKSIIHQFKDKDLTKRKEDFICEYCDIEFFNNKDFYDHCRLLSHQFKAGIKAAEEMNIKIGKLTVPYKPEELGKNGKPKKAYRESRKKFKERMFIEMTEDQEEAEDFMAKQIIRPCAINPYKNESMWQVGDGDQYNFKCLPIEEDWRLGVDKDRFVDIIEPDIDVDKEYWEHYKNTGTPSITPANTPVDDNWFEDMEEIFNLDDMDCYTL